MSARFVWSGLQELKAALRALPDDLAGEAATLVQARGNAAAAAIVAGYPVFSGELQRGVKVTHTRSRFGARAVVVNTSKAALPFETGSQMDRHTRAGENRGTAPANPLFTQTMRRARRGLYGDLRDLLTRHGLLVTET